MPKRSANPDDYRMSFGEHIEELRRRLIYILVGVLIVFVAATYYGRVITAWLEQPLMETLRQAGLPPTTYTRSSLTGLAIWMKVSLFASLVVAAPWIFYHLWRFVEAGLYATERRAVLFIVSLSTVMTTVGMLFLYYVLLPAVLSFLILFTTTYPPAEAPDSPLLRRSVSYFKALNEHTLLSKPPTVPTASAPATTQPMLVPILEGDPPKLTEGQLWFNTRTQELRLVQDGRIRVLTATPGASMVPLIDPGEYFNEVLWLVLVVLVIFHVPVIMTVLGMTGLIDPAWLARGRRYVIFGIFLAALFITPSQDVFSNVVLPLLVWLLFEFGLVLMRIFYRRALAARQADALEEASTPEP